MGWSWQHRKGLRLTSAAFIAAAVAAATGCAAGETQGTAGVDPFNTGGGIFSEGDPNNSEQPPASLGSAPCTDNLTAQNLFSILESAVCPWADACGHSGGYRPPEVGLPDETPTGSGADFLIGVSRQALEERGSDLGGQGGSGGLGGEGEFEVFGFLCDFARSCRSNPSDPDCSVDTSELDSSGICVATYIGCLNYFFSVLPCGNATSDQLEAAARSLPPECRELGGEEDIDIEGPPEQGEF